MVLGGTRQENNYNTNVDIDDRKFIFDGCVRMMPALKHAEIVGDMVGLRPGRTQVRLERDVFKTSREKIIITVAQVRLISVSSFFQYYRKW